MWEQRTLSRTLLPGAGGGMEKTHLRRALKDAQSSLLAEPSWAWTATWGGVDAQGLRGCPNARAALCQVHCHQGQQSWSLTSNLGAPRPGHPSWAGLCHCPPAHTDPSAGHGLGPACEYQTPRQPFPKARTRLSSLLPPPSPRRGIWSEVRTLRDSEGTQVLPGGCTGGHGGGEATQWSSRRLTSLAPLQGPTKPGRVPQAGMVGLKGS